MHVKSNDNTNDIVSENQENTEIAGKWINRLPHIGLIYSCYTSFRVMLISVETAEPPLSPYPVHQTKGRNIRLSVITNIVPQEVCRHDNSADILRDHSFRMRLHQQGRGDALYFTAFPDQRHPGAGEVDRHPDLQPHRQGRDSHQ